MEYVVLLAVACFLGWKLYSVLGQRHDSDTSSLPRVARPALSPDDAPPFAQPNPQSAFRPRPPAPGEPASLAQQMEALKGIDPAFEERRFLDGARRAFDMIVGAFAAGDRETLGHLLSPPLLEAFGREIDRRAEAGETHSVTIRRYRDVDVEAIELEAEEARVKVRFATEQDVSVRDAAGAQLDGAEGPVEVIDVWTFARDPRSSDPTWRLVQTAAA